VGVSALPQIRAIQANQTPQKFVIVTQNSPQPGQTKVVRRGSSPHSVVLSAASNGANASNSNSNSSASGSGNGGSLLSAAQRSSENVCVSAGSEAPAVDGITVESFRAP